MRPLTLSIAQLNDPRLIWPLIGSLALSASVLALAVWGSVLLLHHELAAHEWLGWLAGALGGVGVAALSLWLFLPLALAITGLFLGVVADAVERRHYPELPRPQGASAGAQVWDGIVLGAQILGLQVVSLVLGVLLPGVGFLLGSAITAWAIARGMMVCVAMRRMSRQAARQAYATHRTVALGQGALLMLIGSIPPLNLLVPILGTAMMVHVLQAPPAAAR